MPLTLIIEDGSGVENANTYISLANAEIYFESRANKAVWSGASDDDKNIALVDAARQMDMMFDWFGSRATEDQGLRFPRFSIYDPDGWMYDSNEIPSELKDAQCEIALGVLAEDRTDDPDGIGIKRVKAGSVEVEFDSTKVKTTIPPIVLSMLRHLGNYLPGYGSANRRLQR